MKIKNLIVYACLLVGLLASACQFPGGYYGDPLPGLHYRAPLPDASVQFSFADRFSEELAKRADLKIIDVTQTDNQSMADKNIRLQPNSGEAIYLTVTVDKIYKHIFIIIEGPDWSTPQAAGMAKTAQDIYAEWFPGSQLEAYNAYRGVLGP